MKMFILHCTKKAQDRLKIKPSEIIHQPTTCLGNWYCNEFTSSRSKYLIFVNESTLLPVVISVKELKTSEDIMERFRQRLFKIFLFLKMPENKFMPELLEMDHVIFAKTKNRHVIGSMNDLISQTKFLAEYHGILPDSLAMFKHISGTPLKANDFRHSIDMVAECFK